MRRKQLWLMIAALITLNCLTVAYFLSKENELANFAVTEDVVATVGKGKISRQEWLNELETRYGKDVLKDMIDQKVVLEMAMKYKIEISEEDIEREYRLLQTRYSSFNELKSISENRWKEQIRNSLLKEEILTKDVVVSDKELKAYYEKNKELFNIPTTFHLSHLIVKTKSEAETALKELSEGSSFAVLAMERSIEEFSANEGGDIGYLVEEDERYPAEYIQAVKKLADGEWSGPIKVEQGYAIILLEGKIKGKDYSFEEVKQPIRRQIAIEQMKTSATTEVFWEEVKVDWFYGTKKE
ncbi:peptidyl-prolyl cis-trans isomerase [Bacillus sp. MRMR6]|uniref:peptidyl-prolyl cis-trans isomerase n=1 Tax=Bacillus sp. MRMR6 TaxID=1928617 RepID=UPI0009513961|nr:peptidyl-prolyl cis-trans isomerase [Bacillus sp. MRMR6]OLS34127.1 peptidylprolyl isomerase [Bacillus sp. MRMR6]